MPVYQTDEGFQNSREQVQVVRDCVGGARVMRSAGARYLPEFVPPDAARYSDYVMRAIFHNVTGYTLTGMLGAMFRREPVLTVPDVLAYLAEDCDGGGQSIQQLAHQISAEIWKTGRCGVLVDMPPTDPNLSAEDETRLGLRPTINLYSYESVIGVNPLRLVDNVEVQGDDEFSRKVEKRIRVLDWSEGKYRVRLYNEKGEQIGPDLFPTMAGGKPFDRIPFTFVGVYNNTGEHTTPPLYDIAELNVGHWRNSADYEEGVHMHGQPTMLLWSAMNAQDFKAANPSGVRIGARAAHFLGEGGGGELLQMSSNSAAFEAMKNKEAQMIALGARLISENSSTKTATQAGHEAVKDSSVLSLIASNVEEAIEAACEFAAMFVGADPEQIEFDMNKEFFDDDLSPQARVAMMQELSVGIIAPRDYRDRLRRAGELAADRTDEVIDEERQLESPLA